MGISISIFEGAVPRFPLEIQLSLICDGEQHQQLVERGPMYQAFRHSNGFIGCYHAAMNAGWKDTHRNGERIFLGPCCSGKEARDGSV